VSRLALSRYTLVDKSSSKKNTAMTGTREDLRVGVMP
jgi:hypothetical protein